MYKGVPRTETRGEDREGNNNQAREVSTQSSLAERSQPRGRKTVTGANVREQVGAEGREGGGESSKDLPST